MKNPKLFKKIFMIVGLIVFYILISSFIACFSRSKNKRKLLCENCSWFSKAALRILGISVSVTGYFPDYKKSFFVVCNHVSYLDVLIISSVFPASFITSVEIARDFFLGTLARLGGSIFVERRKKRRLLKDLDAISKVLSSNLNVVLFPEGTSSNGEIILPFKKTLFRAAIRCRLPVLPVYICYVSIDGDLITPKNRDIIFWYGDMKFFPHFLSLLSINRICVCLEFFSVIPSNSMKVDNLAKTAYQTILQAHQRIAQKCG